jgi:tRNA threonylcarbamoyladenosine biosynthesis protein TsaB
MRVLAFDTATSVTSVALRDLEAGVDLSRPDLSRPDLSRLDVSRLDSPAPGARPGHAQKLLEMVHQLLLESGEGWDQVDRIAVGAGPGTFTGLRIGIATAQALAMSAGVELVGVSTLQSLALAAHHREPGCATLAVIDARRGEAFVAGWGADASPLREAPTLAPSVLTPEQLGRVGSDAGTRAGTRTIAVGDGALKFRDRLEGAGVEVPDDDSPLQIVAAREHCEIAMLAEPAVDNRVEPQYLRVPDAEL